MKEIKLKQKKKRELEAKKEAKKKELEERHIRQDAAGTSLRNCNGAPPPPPPLQ